MSLNDSTKLCHLVRFSVYSNTQNSKQCKLKMRHLFTGICGHNSLLYFKKNTILETGSILYNTCSRSGGSFQRHMDIDKRNRFSFNDTWPKHYNLFEHIVLNHK